MMMKQIIIAVIFIALLIGIALHFEVNQETYYNYTSANPTKILFINSIMTYILLGFIFVIFASILKGLVL
jgi:Zn-dependent protease